MRLRKLKKQLKRRELQTLRQHPRRWFLVILLLTLCSLLLYPAYQQYQQTAPARLLRRAIALASEGAVDSAQEVYQKLYQQYPETEQAPLALYRSARIWQFELRQEQQAVLSYLELEHDYPDHPLVAAARIEAARILKYSQRNYPKAIVIYQRLLEAKGPQADQYLYEIADCYFRMDQYDQARIEFEIFLTDFPESRLLPKVLYRKGSLLLLKNRQEEARQDWQRLINEFPKSRFRVHAQFNIARSFEEESRLQDALERYQQLKEYPQPQLLQQKIKHLKQRIANKKKAI